MKKFTLEERVPVPAPYRLDLTVDALRRLAANVVDVVDEAGIYRRALADDRGVNLIEVTQPAGHYINVRIAGAQGRRWLPRIERMLGVRTNIDEWYARVRPFPWLAFLTDRLRGLRPPQYPSLWEAMAHAIVFQQISIHAAASIMRRLIEGLGEPVDLGEKRYYPFLQPQVLLAAPEPALRAAGLSANKIMHLRNAAQAVAGGTLDAESIDALPSVQAAQRLCGIRGIGPWSAAVVLLRGFGRLDVFPMKDSGVARSIKLLSAQPAVDAYALLEALGPVRGMLYFHLLLGRIRNLTATPPDSELT